MPPPPCCARTAGAARRRPLRALGCQSRCAEVRQRRTEARLFPPRLGSEPLWMWECGCRRQRALLDTRRRCAHRHGSPQRLAVVQVSGLVFGGDVAGSPVSLGTEQLCVCFFKNSTHFFLGIFLPCWGGDENEREARKDSPAPWSHALQAA